MPLYQVMSCHATAPSSPERTTCGSTYCTLMRPLPTVLATAVPNANAAPKLKNAAQMTAWSGESTRVETTVAMEFAESLKPLMKSKTNAIATIARTKATVPFTERPDQPCLIAMLSSTLATSSAWSTQRSRLS